MKDCLVSRVPSPASMMTRFGHGARVTGLWTLLFLILAACGAANEAPVPAALSGDRTEGAGLRMDPATDLGVAPTAAHGRLAALLPREALRRDTVSYSDWDQASAKPAGEDPAKATLPTVKAEYASMGYKVITDDKEPGTKKRAQLEYPQECVLVLVKAPDREATEAIAARLRVNFIDNGFAEQEPVKINDGTKDGIMIERCMRIDSGPEADKVYVAYMQVIGEIVVYAIESEQPPPIKTADGTQARRVMSGQLGTRLGGQLITLVGASAAR